MKIKLLHVHNKREFTFGQDGHGVGFLADCEIDGEKKPNITAVMFKPDTACAFEAGETLTAQMRPNRRDPDVTEYVVSRHEQDRQTPGRPAGGRTNYVPPDPEAVRIKERAIMLENCLTNSVSFMQGLTSEKDAYTSDNLIAMTIKVFRALWAEANSK